MTREKQDGEWPPKSNPLDDLEWEMTDNPNGKIARAVKFSNYILFIAVTLGLAVLFLGGCIALALKMIGV